MKKTEPIAVICLVVLIIFLFFAFVVWGGCDLIENKLAPQNIYMVSYRDNLLKKVFRTQEALAIRIEDYPPLSEYEFLGFATSQNGDRYAVRFVGEYYILVHVKHRAAYKLSEKSRHILEPFIEERKTYMKKILKDHENDLNNVSKK
jgi:hypothetical protein